MVDRCGVDPGNARECKKWNGDPPLLPPTSPPAGALPDQRRHWRSNGLRHPYVVTAPMGAPTVLIIQIINSLQLGMGGACGAPSITPPQGTREWLQRSAEKGGSGARPPLPAPPRPAPPRALHMCALWPSSPPPRRPRPTHPPPHPPPRRWRARPSPGAQSTPRPPRGSPPRASPPPRPPLCHSTPPPPLCGMLASPRRM